MKGEALSVRNLEFSYTDKPALTGVSFDVREGEYLSVVGPNGAGKSTLARCVNRILTGWTGEITLFGASLTKLDQRGLARLVGYVPQPGERSIPFTVEEFVLMGRYPYLNPFTQIGTEDKEAVREAMEQTGVTHLAARHVDSLSGGERQLSFIAAALAQGAKLLLLDEPTAFLDYKHQTQCLSLLKRMNRDFGVTMIYITHDLNHALASSDRVLAIKNGRVAFHGTPQELISNGVLEAIYETQFTAYRSDDSTMPVLMPRGGGA